MKGFAKSGLIVFVVIGLMSSCALRRKSAKAQNTVPIEVVDKDYEGALDAKPGTFDEGEMIHRDQIKSTEHSNSKAGKKTPPRANIYATSEDSYRFLLSADRVWESLISVLLKNYNLNLVQKDTGLITTEWDSYFLGQQLYRNKLSIRIVKIGSSSCELTIHNKVEQIEGSPVAGGVWLPAPKNPDEAYRIVKNMALTLDQAPPLAPQGAVANSVDPTEENQY